MLSEAASFSSGLARSKEQRSEQAFYQAAAGDASGAMSHLDLRLAKPHFRRRAVADDSGLQAGHARVVAIVLRCS